MNRGGDARCELTEWRSWGEDEIQGRICLHALFMNVVNALTHHERPTHFDGDSVNSLLFACSRKWWRVKQYFTSPSCYL